MRSKVLIVAFGSLRATQQLASSGNSHPRDGQLLEPLMGRSDASKDVMAPSEIGRLRRRVIDTRSAAKGAIDALNSRFYDSEQAIWSPGAPWWLSGVAITSVIDYMHKTRSSDYMDQVNTMIEKQRAPLAWWPQGDGDFRGDSTDDTGWWGLAMIRMFDLTGNATYLNISMEDEAYMYESWTDTACGGGIYVDIEKQTYKNAIANELYIKLAASLHNRVNNDTFYLERAETAWSWFRRSGMINSNNLINDGLSKRSDGSCVNNKLPVWTYNEGVILGGLSELYLGTSNTTYLTTARTLADALLLNTTMSPSTPLSPNSTIKILTEICEPPQNCNHDQVIFKGILALNLAELDTVIAETPANVSGGGGGDHPYREYLLGNAQTMYDRGRRNATNLGLDDGDGDVVTEDLYDVYWAGPYRNSSIGKQAGAVGLLVAVV